MQPMQLGCHLRGIGPAARLVLLVAAVYLLAVMNVTNESNARRRPLWRGSGEDAFGTEGGPSPRQNLTDDEAVPEAKTKVIILFWNSYYIWSHYGMGVGNRGFLQAGCAMANCHTTVNRNKYKVADAIVFHGEGLADPRLVAELTTLKTFRLEARAAGNKAPLFVYFMKEPPHVGNRLNHSVFEDFFDVTLTYQPDSDVEAAYGRFVPLDPSGDAFWPRWRPFLPSARVLGRDVAAKTRDVAWIVSHCDTDSRRERYVAALRAATHLTVDVYGDCAERKLPLPPRPTEQEYERQALAQVQTYVTVLKPYKFYLSFENSLCMNYVTEKFFYTYAFDEGPLPVALGGYARSDYSKFAPPHSYLHVDDFESVEHLARELERLSSNVTAYNEYFWWQDYYKLNNEWDNHKRAQCQLCLLLNKILNGQAEPSVYANMTEFWSIETRCKPSKY